MITRFQWLVESEQPAQRKLGWFSTTTTAGSLSWYRRRGVEDSPIEDVTGVFRWKPSTLQLAPTVDQLGWKSGQKKELGEVGEDALRSPRWQSRHSSPDSLQWLSKQRKELGEPGEEGQRLPRWRSEYLTLPPVVATDNLGWKTGQRKDFGELGGEGQRIPQWQSSYLTLPPVRDQLDWKTRPRDLTDYSEETKGTFKWNPSYLSVVVSTTDQLGWRAQRGQVESLELSQLPMSQWKPWLVAYNQPTNHTLLTLPLLHVGS